MSYFAAAAVNGGEQNGLYHYPFRRGGETPAEAGAAGTPGDKSAGRQCSDISPARNLRDGGGSYKKRRFPARP